MKRKHIILTLSLSLVAGMSAILGFNSFNKQYSLFASEHICYGNHYEEINENELEDGCHEYWVCCQCHEHYLSTKEIPHYSPSNWIDSGTYQRIDNPSDTRHIPSLFEETISKEGCGFTYTDNTLTGSLTNDGWIVSKEQYLNFSFDAVMNVSSRCNPYGNHEITNAIVIGGQIDDGKLSGYVLQIQDCFTELFYLDGVNDNVAGNCITLTPEPWTDYKNRTLHISVEKNILSVSCDGNRLFDDVYLDMKGYMNGYVDYSTSNISYNGGHIGLISYEDSEDASRRGVTLTVNNFVRGDHSLLSNAHYNDGNDWTLNNNNRTIVSSNNDGFVLTNNSYNNVSLRVKANSGVGPNIWSEHTAFSSIILGGKYENGHLSGYVVEIQNNHFEIAKLSGDGYQTGSVLGLIGHWGDGGADFITANKNLFIEINDKVLTLSSIDELNRNTENNPNMYPTFSITLNDYEGGQIGYLSHQEGSHNITIDRLDFTDTSYDNVLLDVVKGRFLENGNLIINKSGDSLGLIKDTSFTSGTYSCEVSSKDTNECGIIFASNNDGSSYYSFVLRGIYGNQIVLNKCVNGTVTELGSCYITAGYSASNTVTLKVEYNSGDIKCFFNKSMLIYRVDESPLSGNRVGIMSKNNGSEFSNYVTSSSRNFSSVDTLIIGHSYMELWSNYKEDLNKYTDIENIGIGGTATNDWMGHRNEVRAYAPNRLIYMIGINDVPRGTSAQTIVDNIKTLINGVMNDLPLCKICLLSMNRCPNVNTSAYQQVIADSNALLKAYVNSNINLYYGDLDNAFLTGGGEPDASCFTDGLHPTSASYKTIAQAIYNAFGD